MRRSAEPVQAESQGSDVWRELAMLLGRPATKIGHVRKTGETTPRISAIDVIMLMTGKGSSRAARDLDLVKERYPDVAENLGTYKFKGRRQRETTVATARGIIEVVMLLPGRQGECVRRRAAELLVRYLGGDLMLVGEVCALRGAQNALRQSSPNHPARVFGEAVEGVRQKRTHEDMEQAIRNVVDAAAERIASKFDEALRRIHSIDPSRDFANSARGHNALLDVGVIIEGDELTLLDKDEHVVRITDFLQDRVTREAWYQYGRKFKNIFAVELKKAKLKESSDTGVGPFIARAQGEFRIVYTEADTDLMVRVFVQCERRFKGIVARDAAALRAHRKHKTLLDFFTRPM
jgi:hypothetical protein